MDSARDGTTTFCDMANASSMRMAGSMPIRLAEAALDHHVGDSVTVRPVADHQRRQRPADPALGPGKGIDKEIGTLQVSQHADIDEMDTSERAGIGSNSSSPMPL